MAQTTGQGRATVVVKRGASARRPHATKATEAELDALIEEATVDAYDESEQLMGLHTMLAENLVLPFKTEVLGVEVTVEKLELTDDNRIAAICTRDKLSQRIAILDLPLPKPPPRGAEWVDAYRRWGLG